LQDESRNDPNAIRRLLIDSHDGTRIPLSQLADIEETFGPSGIRREAGTRRIVLEAGVDGRDLGSTAADIRGRLVKQLSLPPAIFLMSAEKWRARSARRVR
jgi:heavy metal efflux system protein